MADLFELRKSYEGQMVLHYGSNNPVVITNDDLDPNSKFFRRSRIRLGMDFTEIDAEKGITVFRTYRPEGNDYLLYIAENYDIVLAYKKRKSYKYNIERTNKQMTIKNLTKPNKECIMDARFSYDSNNRVGFILHSDNFREEYNGVYHSHLTDLYAKDIKYCSWYKEMAAIMYCLRVISQDDWTDHYHVIRFHIGNRKDIVRILKDKQHSKKQYINKLYSTFRDTVNNYKDVLADHDISIVFMYD